jgi:hypothetical protein
LKKILPLLFSILLLSGCQKARTDQPIHDFPPPKTSDVVEQTYTLLDYFPTKPITKQFLGIGNEFAQYKETIFEKDGDYYPAIVDNGGTRLLRIYKVTEAEISIVYEQPEYYEERPPSLSSLEQSFIEIPLITLPLEVGKRNGDWEIVNVTETLTVPFGKFIDVIVLEKQNHNGSINRQYWVRKLGKVKDDYLIKDESGNLYEVYSELEAVK